MPDTREAAIVALFVIVPGFVGSTAWRNATGHRASEHEQFRVGAVLVWAVLAGTVTALLGARVRWAFEHAALGRPDVGEIALLLNLALTGPWIAGTVCGHVVRNLRPRLPRLLRWSGVIGTEATTPWDDVFANNVKGIQVTFYWDGRPFIANFRLADRDGDQLYLSEPHEWSAAGQWERMADHTGVLLRFDSDLQVVWLKNLDDYVPPAVAAASPSASPAALPAPAAAPAFADELRKGLGLDE